MLMGLLPMLAPTACLSLLVLAVSAQDNGQPQVSTKLGKITGKQLLYKDLSVDAYMSVPFAKPPLGDLRFRKSEPVEPWDETIVADQNPPACPQYTPAPFPWYDGEPGHNEDCLYMNIFVPSVPKQGRAILFWIYGGGFFVGSNRAPVYDGRALAATGDIIVITINYRLGPLGFLYSGTDDAPGNVGIYDMVLGLQWVNENIEAFGGDPDSITIMGQSAGSIAVSYLTVSPLTKGLYKRAILQSGSAFSLPAGNEIDLQMGQSLAEKLGCADSSKTLQDNPKEVVDCLRGIDANELVQVVGEMYPRSSRTFLPTFGDEILGENPRDSLSKGNFHDTDVLTGNVADEGSFQLTTSNPDVFGFFGEKNTLINRSFAEMLLRNTFSRFPNGEEAVQYYLGSVSDDDGEAIRRQVYTASGDFTLLCPTVYSAEKFAENKNNVYYYFFTHRPSTSPWAPWMGAVHFEEVQFVFGEPALDPSKYQPEEVELSERIMKIWSDFAKNGNPGENWPLYSTDEQNLRILDVNESDENGQGPHSENCAFLKKYFDLSS